MISSHEYRSYTDSEFPIYRRQEQLTERCREYTGDDDRQHTGHEQPSVGVGILRV